MKLKSEDLKIGVGSMDKMYGDVASRELLFLARIGFHVQTGGTQSASTI